jgi:glutamate carboxypeptidase
MRVWLDVLAPLALSAIAGAAVATTAVSEDKVLRAAEAARSEQLQLLSSLVNIDSGTGDIEGGRKVEAMLIPKLKALGAHIERVAAEQPNLPENLVATFDGTGKGRILMIGHIDTVFGPGTAEARPYRVEGSHARGPGVADEKGGVVEGLYALRIIHDLSFNDFGRITFLMDTSEEKGSPGTRTLIKKLLANADVELNLEPGDPPDTLTVWRKGAATFHINVKGKAAHAGINPQDGQNAAMELLHQLSGLKVFAYHGSGTTVNLTVMQAGTRANIIPDSASAQVNVRVRQMADFDKVEQVLAKNAQHVAVPGTTVTVTREEPTPPLPSNPDTDAIASRAKAIYAAIRKPLQMGGNGGASESALAAGAGVPALDGLGPVGGNFHAEGEYMDMASVTPRLYLLTKLIMSLAHEPVKAGQNH